MTEKPPKGLYDRPVLVIDPEVHTGQLDSIDIDAAWHWAATGGSDKTVRIWDASDGRLLRTIRVPCGSGHLGEVYTVAINPDGNLIAVGGCFAENTSTDAERILLFDPITGDMIGTVEGLSKSVRSLSFSPDGLQLAATMVGDAGMRLFSCDERWKEIARDTNYGDHGHFVCHASDGYFATASWDGNVRLYDPSGEIIRSKYSGGRPVRLAFTANRDRLAVAFWDEPRLQMLDGQSLEEIDADFCYYFDCAFPSAVAWSAKDTKLRIGIYDRLAGHTLLGNSDADSFELLSGDGAHPYVGLRLSPRGECLTATSDAWLALDTTDGSESWKVRPAQIDWRDQQGSLCVSKDGTVVEFDYSHNVRARFDTNTLQFSLDPPDDGLSRAPSPGQPDGRAVPLFEHEVCRCLVDHPDGVRSVVGTSWTLRAINSRARQVLWRIECPNVWAVNISGDGRLAIAACGDGTLRWHRMEDGAEILAVFPLLDGENWVAWTPEGIYAASPGARSILRWHVNHGWDAAGEAVAVWDIPETHDPGVIPHVLPQLGLLGVVGIAGLERTRNAVRRVIGSDVAPGAQLHVLAVGVSDYGPGARHLDLAYAHRDARDIAAALRRSQGSLYTHVHVSELVNSEATKADILRELRALRDAMRSGNGSDLAVILFSGHGDVAERDRFFLLPYGVDTSSRDAIEDSALSSVQLHEQVAAIAEHGRVILLIDACRSGGATAPTDRSLRAMLSAPNVTVFTSSTADTASFEDPDWENGAFTEALLEALARADHDRDGLIRVSDLSGYLSDRVPELTCGEQRPDVEIHFDTQVLATTT